MLKLIYHNAVFGPIDLEYCKPVIRVGSSEDNDLVLRHPSVKPHHGWLIFRGERVILALQGEDGDFPVETDVLEVTGTELGVGEQLWIGDLQFSLAYSSITVALPDIPAPAGASCLPAGAAERRQVPTSRNEDFAPPEAPDDSPAEIEAGSDVGQSIEALRPTPSPGGEGRGEGERFSNCKEERLYCSNCHTFVPVAGVKRIGLVGQPKLALCPKCSRALNAEPTSAPALEPTIPEITDKDPKKRFGGILKGLMKSKSV